MITDVKISIENNLELYTIFPLVCILDIFYSKLILFIIREKLKKCFFNGKLGISIYSGSFLKPL